MIMPSHRSRARRVGLFAAVTLAVVLVAAVVVVLLTEDRALDPDEAFPPTVVIDPDKRPEFVFPESIRTFDLSLNRFVDRFARVCMEGRYDDFRLMLSSRVGDPIVAHRFESMFNALRQVRILALDKLPDLPGFDGPVYLMVAEYDLEDYAVTRGSPTEQRRLAITREDGAWRIGPIPHDALARLLAHQRAVTTASEEPADPAAEPGGDAQDPPAPAAAANRPAQVDG